MTLERSGIVTWEVRDGIGRLTLSAPPKNCLVDPEIAGEGALARWLSDESLRGVIVSGEGRHFSAGADIESLKKLALDRDGIAAHMSAGKKALDVILSCEVPVVAAIRGACLGGGLEIALACHIRAACESAFFAFPEAGLSIMPGLGGTVLLPGLAGRARALELILSSDMIGSERALELGLVDHRVPTAELMAFAVSLIDSMTAGRPRRVVTSIVRAINNSRTLPFERALEEETRLFRALVLERDAD